MIKIKPLKWRDQFGDLTAHTPIGMFTIKSIEGGFVYTHHLPSTETKGCRPTLKMTKGRCTEIYEGIIRSVLIEEPSQ